MAVGHWQTSRISTPWRAVLWLVLGGAALLYGMVFAFSPAAALILWLFAVLAFAAARRLEWTALCLFLVVPLGRLTWLNETGTLDLTKFFVAALAIGWAARSLTTKDRRLVSVWTESPITVLIVLFLLVNLISLLNAWDLRRSLLSLVRLSGLFGMYILMVALIRRRRQVEVAVGFLLVTGLVVCLLGVWESLTHQYLWHLMGQDRSLPTGLAEASGPGGSPFALRIITVFIDYNFMGGYMAVLIGIIGGCAMATRRWYLRAALAGLAGLVLYNAVQTGSRGGMMGISVAMLVLLMLSRIRVRWFVLALIVITAIVVFPVADQLVPQFRGGISLDDLKQDQRWGYWQMALRMMQDHPIIGIGTDNFFSLYSWYRVSPALMARYYCHNIYLQMWAEGGILGFLSILSLVIAVAVTYVKSVGRAADEAWRGIVVGLFAAFLGYAVFAATCNTLHDQPFWMLMALSVIAARVTREGRAAAAAAGDDGGIPAEPHRTAAPALP
jgi:O-antigen ligase